MHKKWWKVISLIICFMLITSLLAACSQKTGDVSQDDKIPAEQPQDDKTDDTPAGDSEDEDTPAHGIKPMTLRYMLGEHASQPVDPESPIFKEIENKTGVKLIVEAVPGSDYEQKANTLIATGDMPDIMRLSYSVAKNYAASGHFVAISDYFDIMPNYKRLVESDPQQKKLFIEGKMYTFTVMARHLNRMGRVPMIRMDMIKDLNLKVPDNFDELYEVLKAFKEAHPDSIPWTNRNGTANLLSAIAFPMGATYNIEYDPDVNGGQWTYGTVRPEFKEVLAYVNKLYKEGILDPDYAVNTPQQWQEKLSSGKSFFYYDNGSFAINFNKALEAEGYKDAFGPLPIMENSKGQRRTWYYEPHWYGTCYVVSSKVEDPENVMRFFDWLYSDEGADVTNFGVEGVHYTKEGDEYVIESSLVEEAMKEADPWRSYMSKLGSGLLCFAPYVDERTQWPFMSDYVKSWYDQWANDEGMIEPVLAPSFTAEELERIKELQTKIDTILTQELDKFIMGELPLDEFDSLVEKAKEAGVDELVEIYNNAEARSQ